MATTSTDASFTPTTRSQHTASLTIDSEPFDVGDAPPYTPDRSLPCSSLTQSSQNPHNSRARRATLTVPPKSINEGGCSHFPHSSRPLHLDTYEGPPYQLFRSLQPEFAYATTGSKLTCSRLALRNLCLALPEVAFHIVNVSTFLLALPCLLVYEVLWLLLYLARGAWKNLKKTSLKKIWKGMKRWRGWLCGLKAFVGLVGVLVGS